MITLKEFFYKNYLFKITSNIINEFFSFLINFETKDEHLLVLNSPYIGLHRLIFNQNDRQLIFEIFNIDEEILYKEINKNVSSFNSNYETISDVLNLLLIWIEHLTFTKNIASNISIKKLEEFRIKLLVLLQYKFFSSRIFRIFKYQVNEEVMRYTIEHLNYKYDIVKYENWRNLFYIKSQHLISKNSIHYKTFLSFNPDNKVYYIISDIKTKINSMISSISKQYYENFEANKVILSHDATSNIDGEKILKDSKYIYDTILSYLLYNMENEQLFINKQYINTLIKNQSSVSFGLLYKFLSNICTLYNIQKKENTLDKIINYSDYNYYYGLKTLVIKILLYFYNKIISRKINLNNKLKVFLEIKKILLSGKTVDSELNNIKNTITKYIIDEFKLTRREYTISSLRSIFILYIMLKSFEVLK